MGLFSRIEKAQAGPRAVFLTICAIILVRILLENALEAQKKVEPFVSFFLFFTSFATLIAGVWLIVWWLSKKPVMHAARVVAALSIVMWLPPLADLVISSGRGFVVGFVFMPPPFLSAFATFCSVCAGIPPGIKIEVALIMVLAAAYVFWATRSVLRAGAAALASYAFILFNAFFPGYVMRLFNHPFQDVFLYREVVSAYAIFLTVAILILYRAHNQAAFRRLSERFRPLRSMHYAGLALFGAMLGWNSWQHTLPGALLPLGALLFSIIFAFEAAAWVNDVFDRKIDRLSDKKRANLNEFFNGSEAAWIAAFIGLSFLNGLAAGYGVLVWIAFALALAVAYSVPPLRLRMHFVTASAVIAACSAAVFAAGYSVGLLDQGAVPSAIPADYVLMVFSMVLLASPFKDLKDAKGDKQVGVFTLPAWLGLAKARKITAALVAGGVACFTLLSTIHWIVGAIVAVASAWVVLSELDLHKLDRNIFILEYLFVAMVALWLNGVRFGLS